MMDINSSALWIAHEPIVTSFISLRLLLSTVKRLDYTDKQYTKRGKNCIYTIKTNGS